MARKRHSAEEIIGKLREAEVLMAKGRSVTDAAKAKAIGGRSRATIAGGVNTVA